MTIAIMIGLIFLLLVVPVMSYHSGKENGIAIARRQRSKELEPGCPHIWGQWEYFMQGVCNEEGKHLYKQSAQKRKCEFCGYLEYEKLTIHK